MKQIVCIALAIILWTADAVVKADPMGWVDTSPHTEGFVKANGVTARISRLGRPGRGADTPPRKRRQSARIR